MASTPEPEFVVLPRPRPFFRRSSFLRSFLPVAAVALAGVVALLLGGTPALPFQGVTTLRGSGGSKGELLRDAVVRDLLLRHHVAVEFTRVGSRAGAVGDLDAQDFLLPSGQPAADLVTRTRGASGAYVAPRRLFVSPIVLGTYREYAETLVAAGIATAQPAAAGVEPSFYDLDVARFVELTRTGTTWDQLGLGARGIRNTNVALARTSDVCVSNSAGTWLGLVAFVVGDRVPTTEADAAALGARIRPLLRDQGLPTRSPEELYFVPEGREIAPVAVFYEHQFLAYQLDRAARGAPPDTERVLLYPRPAFQTEPTFLALTPQAERLGELLATDPELRRRALQLGFRLLGPDVGDTEGSLQSVLAERGLPEPSSAGGGTRAVLPDVAQLETMVRIVGDCR